MIHKILLLKEFKIVVIINLRRNIMNHSWKKIVKYSFPFTIIGVVEILIVMIDFMWSKIFIDVVQAISAILFVFYNLLLLVVIFVSFIFSYYINITLIFLVATYII